MNVFKSVVILTCSIIAALAAFIGYQHIFPRHIITSPDTEMKVLKKQIRAGEIQTYTINYCKNSNVKGDVIVQLIGEVQNPTLIETKSNAPEGCGTNTVEIKIPENATPGYRYFRATSTYPLRYRIVTDSFNSESFEVIK